jgi:hypothetical protein
MQRKKWVLLIFVAYILVAHGYAMAIYGISAYNWYTSDQHGRDYVEMVNERGMEWAQDRNFQELCRALPDEPVLIEKIMNNGWIYKSDPDTYLMLDYCPRLEEINYEIAYGSVAFRGDCTTKAILLANILNCKGIDYKVKLSSSYLQGMGHVYLDYDGRLTAKIEQTYLPETQSYIIDSIYITNEGVASTASTDYIPQMYFADIRAVDNGDSVQVQIIKQSALHIGILAMMVFGVNSDKVYQKLKSKLKGRRIRIRFE